jgi:transcription elongation GreA/GreB family factor
MKKKEELIEQLVRALRAAQTAADRLARETAEAANHPEAKPDSDKDTRKIELSYLAAGQAARASELETAIAMLANLPLRRFGPDEAVALGALVTLDVGGKKQRVFLCSAGGGEKLASEGGDVSVVTPQSPLGAGLVGKKIGETFELRVAGQIREVEILALE